MRNERYLYVHVCHTARARRLYSACSLCPEALWHVRLVGMMVWHPQACEFPLGPHQGHQPMAVIEGGYCRDMMTALQSRLNLPEILAEITSPNRSGRFARGMHYHTQIPTNRCL